jgi:hypothetical protein
MKKLKSKLETLRYITPVIWQMIKFRIKVWWHKNF